MENTILLKHPINWGIDEQLVIRLARLALKTRAMENVELSIIFVGKIKAKQLNIKYRSKSYIPQVLGFPLSKLPDADGIIRLGDIVICTQKLKYEVKYAKQPIEKILENWLLHGVDNLLI